MKCPSCSGGPVRVLESRDNGETTRRRKCDACDHRFKTVEIDVSELARLRAKANAPDARRAKMRELAAALSLAAR